jgi:ribonuclease HII
MFGLDEAGRGPVLGSLFVGFVDAPAAVLPPGLADSKDLSEATIIDLATTLYNTPKVTACVREIPVPEIDTGEANVTELTMDRMAGLISECATSDRGVVDACHSDASVFGRLVTERLHGESPPSVEAEHGADTRVEQVMAASILAKHEREQHVAALREQHGDVGSGYPSDPVTQTFLEDYVDTHGELPACARRSWQTSQDALNAAAQTELGAYGTE